MTVLPDGTVIDAITTESGNQRILVRQARTEPPRPAPRTGHTRWMIPHTEVHPETVDAAPEDATWVDVSNSDDAYFGAIATWWTPVSDLAILEHDVVYRPDVGVAFDECPEPWCVFGYADICHPECMEAWANELGCVRFRKELIAAVPDALTAITPDGRDWHNLCDFIGANLRAAGFTHHWHTPPVEHHHMGRHKEAE